jgi:hypothetical protein
MYQDIDKGYMFGYIQTERVAEEYYRGALLQCCSTPRLEGFEASTKLGHADTRSADMVRGYLAG